MTAFTTIIETDIDPRSPVTASLLVALRDNPLAIIDGGATAPRIQSAALEQGAGVQAVATSTIRDLAGTNVKFAPGSVTVAKVATDLSSNMVTNGNSHNHDGGDGLPISFNGVQDDRGLVGDDIATTLGVITSNTVPLGGSWYPAAGWYNIGTDVGIYVLELFVGGVWRSDGGFSVLLGMLLTDGVNVRVRNVTFDPTGSFIMAQQMQP